MIKVLSFGAIVWDIIEGTPYIGGAPFNLAAHLAKCGIASSMLTRLGQDEYGQRSLTEMKRLDVDRSYVQIDPDRPTPTVVVTLSEGGQPHYDIQDNVSYDFIKADKGLLHAVQREKFAAFCFGTLEQRSQTTRESLHKILKQLTALHVFFDVNLRLDYYSREIITASLGPTTILKVNDDEVRVLAELLFGRSLSQHEFSNRIRDKFEIATVLVTRGSRGCLVMSEGVLAEFPGVPVKVADTVGAGDAFSAGFLAELCRGKSCQEAAELANRLGAFVASKPGAIPEYSDEIKKTILRHEPGRL